jgi:hypothetical protein
VEKPPVSENVMIRDAKVKRDDIGIGKNGTKDQEDPELARHISWRKSGSSSNRNNRM